MTDLQTYLAELFEAEGKAFVAALGRVPEDRFSAEPPAGGHSAAWHALHIADWHRLFLSPGLAGVSPDERFAYLGWEDKDFAKAVLGPADVNEADPRERVLAHLEAALAAGLGNLRSAGAERFAPGVTVPTPMGARAVLGGLSTQVRHVAYHRGQVSLVALQLARA